MNVSLPETIRDYIEAIAPLTFPKRRDRIAH